jgi:hypothetical protein
VDFKSHANQALNHLLDLFFGGLFLHCYDHGFSEIPNPRSLRVRDPYPLLNLKIYSALLSFTQSFPSQ